MNIVIYFRRYRLEQIEQEIAAKTGAFEILKLTFQSGEISQHYLNQIIYLASEINRLSKKADQIKTKLKGVENGTTV